ncbi:outer membrane protein TolC [Luteibacter sp. OK325]|uniref:TolC family protein n=1 Tax=Luteibacter sp. OK325 TaxID=2135670 RepID=UPI000D342A09|nr:TolC family protein [Luteibacter sp. OK325]PTR33248.1 outer membrane protein TolC [Luteibacter sp. OK325]
MHDLAKPAHGRVFALILAVALGGCASYRPLPLVSHPDLATRVEDLQGAGDVRMPLDETAVMHLVLLNNPALAASRTQRGIARAGELDASVLPNPSVQANLGFLISGGGDVPAWSAGFAQSLQGLVTRGARRQEAHATASAIDAQLVWESWVTLSRARQLVVDVVDGERRLALQESSASLLEARASSLHAALARGDEEAGSANAIFVAASDARATCEEARHTLRGQRAELATLLRLDPDAPLPLAPLPALPPLDLARATSSVASMGEHRPDLAALRFGYAAQEARLRGAILSRFAPLSIGVDASRDSDRVLNVGPSVSSDLPVFDRQQGKIAIADATREQLHDEYTARIDAATADARVLISAIVINEREASRGVTDVAALDAANRAFARGDIDAAVYGDLSVATLGQAANDVTRDLYRREQIIALDALTGAGLPDLLPPRMNP